MTAQDYIKSKLLQLAEPSRLKMPETKPELIEAIFRTLMTKKFRKYAASEELQAHVRNAISLNVEKNEPINITFLHGAYKLWRLEEAPEVDWAELFAGMHYTRWVKPVCEMYPPGVWFDFFVDDLIINRLDNIPLEDIQTYISTYQSLLEFLRPYQPHNLQMTLTPVGSKFASEQAFDESLSKNLEAIEIPTLTTEQAAMVELNVKPKVGQTDNPEWREKVFQLHNAYSLTKAEPGYHKNRPDKILAFPQSLPMAVAVGSTKDSVMKFWIGVGALKPRDGAYRQVILSPHQLERANYTHESMCTDGLVGKNFQSIRVLTGV